MNGKLPEVKKGEKIEVFDFFRGSPNEDTRWTAERLAETFQTIADRSGRIVTEYTLYTAGDTKSMQIVAAFPGGESEPQT